MFFKTLACSLMIVLNINYLIAGEKCLSGTYHKNFSSPGSKDFVECLSYKNNACCTAELTETIKYHPETLYNFTWSHCNAISPKCLRYLKNEECFFQCEPSLIRYQRPGVPYAAQNVPICSSYCDKWFDACKDESTCVVNWESDFVVVNNHYACPQNSKCRTFKQVYMNASGLCNRMWGVSFSYYSGSNKCYTMGPHISSGIILRPISFSIMAAIFVALLLFLVSPEICLV
eukprot:gene313-943_t